MQVLTSPFPSSNRSHDGVQLENIIFYSGPASVKTREITPVNADEWPEVDTTFAEASQRERVAAIVRLGPAGGFDITGGGERWS